MASRDRLPRLGILGSNVLLWVDIWLSACETEHLLPSRPCLVAYGHSVTLTGLTAVLVLLFLYVPGGRSASDRLLSNLQRHGASCL